jgi:hypothetical protein
MANISLTEAVLRFLSIASKSDVMRALSSIKFSRDAFDMNIRIRVCSRAFCVDLGIAIKMTSDISAKISCAIASASGSNLTLGARV